MSGSSFARPFAAFTIPIIINASAAIETSVVRVAGRKARTTGIYLRFALTIPPAMLHTSSAMKSTIP